MEGVAYSKGETMADWDRALPDGRTLHELARDIGDSTREITAALEQIQGSSWTADPAIWQRYSAAYARLTDDNDLFLRVFQRPKQVWKDA